MNTPQPHQLPWQTALTKTIKEIMAVSITEAEYKKLMLLREKILESGRDAFSYEEIKLYWDSEEMLLASSITAATLPQYRFVLKSFGYKEPLLHNTIAYRNAQVSIGLQLGASPKYSLIAISGPNRFTLKPRVIIDFPFFWRDSRIYPILRQILLAPVAYGCTLSQEDHKEVARLEFLISQIEPSKDHTELLLEIERTSELLE